MYLLSWRENLLIFLSKKKFFFRMFSKAEKIKIFFLLGYNNGVTKAKKREKNRGTKRYVSMAVTVSTKNSTSTNNKCSFILCPPAYPSVFFLLPIPIIFFQFLYILFFPFFFFCCWIIFANQKFKIIFWFNFLLCFASFFSFCIEQVDDTLKEKQSAMINWQKKIYPKKKQTKNCVRKILEKKKLRTNKKAHKTSLFRIGICR